MKFIQTLLLLSCLFAVLHCAGSEIKVSTETYMDIQALEKRKLKLKVLFMYIGKDPECTARCVEKVRTERGENFHFELLENVTPEEQSKDLVKKIERTLTHPPWDSHSDLYYVSFFVNFKTNDGSDSDKLIWITWNPDNAKIKDKMKFIISSTKVLNKFSSTPTKHQASDADDLSWKSILQVVCKECKYANEESIGIEVVKNSESNEAQIKELFEAADSTGDGFIVVKELGGVFKKLGLKLTVRDVRSIVYKFDADKDKKLNYEEFSECVSSILFNKESQVSEFGAPDGQNMLWEFVEFLAIVGLSFGVGYMLAKYKQKETQNVKHVDYEALNVEMS